MKTPLYDYQRYIVDAARRPSAGFIVEAGKGKTLMALEYFNTSPASKILVVAPNAKIEEWAYDINSELGLNAIGLNKGTKKNKALLKEGADAYVIRYENATLVKFELRSLIDNTWMIILDESHSIKNLSKSTRTQWMLSELTPHKLILTATPQSKGWEDYFPQIKFLGGISGSMTSFKNKYCELQRMDMGGHQFDKIIGYKDNIEEFKDIVHNYCEFYYPSLGDEVVDTIISVPKHESYDFMRKHRVYDRVRAGYAGVLHQYLKQLSSGVFNDKVVHTNKIDALRKILVKYPEDDIVVFYYLNSELDIIIELTEEMGRSYYQHNGAVKDAEEYMLSDRRENAIILAQYQAGGTGLNWMVKSRIAWFHSLPDRHPPFIQARKRLDRIGQTELVRYYIPITEGTIEMANYKTIREGKDFDQKRINEALAELDVDI